MIAQRIDGSVIRPERLPPARAERARRLLLLVADLPQRGNDLAADERQRDEHRRKHHRREREQHLHVVLLEPAAEPSLSAVEEEQRQAHDDGRRARGRSTNALRNPFPRKSRRTMSSAQTTPNTVLSGTAIAATRSVGLNAWSVSGVVSAFHAASAPFSNVRQNTIASGPTSTARR